MKPDKKQKLWKSRIEEQEQSELSISSWCKEHKLSTRQFHYWKKKISEPTNSTKFAEVQVPSTTFQEAQNIYLKYQGVEIYLEEDVNLKKLLGLLKVLKQL